MTPEAIRELYDMRRDDPGTRRHAGNREKHAPEPRIAGFEILDQDIEDIFGASSKQSLC